jgi:hypothetical protein
LLLGASNEEAHGLAAVLLPIFTSAANSARDLGSAELILIEAGIADTLRIVSMEPGFDSGAPATRVNDLIAHEASAKATIASLPKQRPPAAHGLHTGTGAAPNTALFAGLSTVFGNDLLKLATSEKMNAQLVWAAAKPGQPGFGLLGYPPVLQESSCGLIPLLKYFAASSDTTNSLRVAFNAQTPVIVQFLLTSIIVAGEPWCLLAVLREHLPFYFRDVITRSDSGLDEMHGVMWHLAPDFMNKFALGTITLGTADIYEHVIRATARARNKDLVPGKLATVVEQYYGLERDVVLMFLTRILSSLGYLRHTPNGLPELIAGEVARYYAHPEALRETFKARSVQVIEQYFVDFARTQRELISLGPLASWPTQTGPSAMAAQLSTRAASAAQTSIEILHSEAYQLQAEHIKSLVAAAASSAFATNPSAMPPARIQPPPKKLKAAVPVSLAASATAAAGTASGRKTFSPLTPGSLAHNATVLGDNLTIKFDARGPRPADTVVISITALAAASGANVADCCWQCCWLMALSGKPTRKDRFPLAHCSLPLDPAHGAFGNGMHNIPSGLTQAVAQSFR